jgi:PilZ domain
MRASSQAIPDRRQAPRIKLVEIAYIGMGPENGGLVLDVSDGGLSFHAVAPVREDETINFLLSLRGHSRIEGAGEVVWTNEMKTVCGLRFTSLSAGAREHLSSWTNQTHLPETAREEVLSVPRPAIAKVEEAPAPLAVQSLMEVQPVFAIPPASEFYLSQPTANSWWRESALYWILFGVLCFALGLTVFVYGIRVGKSEVQSTAHSVLLPDSQSGPQTSESAADPASSTGNDAPSVSATTPQSDAGSVHADVPSAPNGEPSHANAFVNASKTDGILAGPLPQPPAVGGLDTSAADQHAEVALEAGKSELAAAQAALRGTDGVRDSAKAARLLWAAVANDNSTAAVILADLYLRGDGVPKSCEQGRVLLTAASNTGDVQGQEKLKELNANGCQ